MNTKKLALYLDDLRTPTQQFPELEPWQVVRNYEEFVQWIKTHGIPYYVSLDHDLADEHMADYFDHQAQGIPVIHYDHFKEKTGVDCLSYLLDIVHRKIEAGEDPVLSVINVHSHNPVGSNNMISDAQNFAKNTHWLGNITRVRIPFNLETIIK